MVVRKKKNKFYIIIGIFLILLGIVFSVYKPFYEYFINKKENNSVEVFFEKPIIENQTTISDKKETTKKSKKSTYNYIAILEIPSISFKRGLVAKNDKANNVNKNIQILKESDMPDVQNGNFIIAGHSGTSRISFFKDLHRVKKGNLIYVYYKNIKYKYKVSNIFLEKKDGTIINYKTNDKSILTLTTCSQEHKGNQLVVISDLVDQENY